MSKHIKLTVHFDLGDDDEIENVLPEIRRGVVDLARKEHLPVIAAILSVTIGPGGVEYGKTHNFKYIPEASIK